MASDLDQEIVKSTLDRILQQREHPKTICPSEVARGLPSEEMRKLNDGWRDAMPLVREILFEMKDNAEVEILQKGQVLPMETRLEDIRGPIRARLVLQNGSAAIQ
ncbi:MAG: hypothetical protein GOMPHAMPRED_004460 [Gomphillus americanus]|uniref:Uncharacterized protein n=1 Tax=Gomphillus americanus TaxID=1940652 RepID=A0A8H3FQP5_9LECA|nr:MAG: hypothetical protein GOMPHAMPRED_004460 [Gomphillus americanus]